MEDALLERVSKLEERFGIANAENITNVNEELALVRKKLTEAGCGFLLKVPSEILRKVNDLATGVSFL